VEFVELPAEVHPYYVGTQAHPEFRSRPTRAHPLFAGLVAAALHRQAEERLDLEPETDRPAAPGTDGADGRADLPAGLRSPAAASA
jgi:CTP synthase